MTEAEYESESKFTGELWDVNCEDLGENLLHYNTTL